MYKNIDQTKKLKTTSSSHYQSTQLLYFSYNWTTQLKYPIKVDEKKSWMFLIQYLLPINPTTFYFLQYFTTFQTNENVCFHFHRRDRMKEQIERRRANSEVKYQTSRGGSVKSTRGSSMSLMNHRNTCQYK